MPRSPKIKDLIAGTQDLVDEVTEEVRKALFPFFLEEVERRLSGVRSGTLQVSEGRRELLGLAGFEAYAVTLHEEADINAVLRDADENLHEMPDGMYRWTTHFEDAEPVEGRQLLCEMVDTQCYEASSALVQLYSQLIHDTYRCERKLVLSLSDIGEGMLPCPREYFDSAIRNGCEMDPDLVFSALEALASSKRPRMRILPVLADHFLTSDGSHLRLA